MQWKVGNGRNTFLRFDRWHPFGPLLQVYSPQIMKLFGSCEKAKVSIIIMKGQWCWPQSRKLKGEALNSVRATPDFLSNKEQEDQVVWMNEASKAYSTKSAMKQVTTAGVWYHGTNYYGVRIMFQLMLSSYGCYAKTGFGVKIDWRNGR